MSSLKLISRQNCRNTKNQKLVLKYYLTESAGSNKTYGVKLEKYRISGRDEILEDDDYVDTITANQREMISIIKTLAKNTVTPITLVDVLDEIIS